MRKQLKDIIKEDPESQAIFKNYQRKLLTRTRITAIIFGVFGIISTLLFVYSFSKSIENQQVESRLATCQEQLLVCEQKE